MCRVGATKVNWRNKTNKFWILSSLAQGVLSQGFWSGNLAQTQYSEAPPPQYFFHWVYIFWNFKTEYWFIFLEHPGLNRGANQLLGPRLNILRCSAAACITWCGTLVWAIIKPTPTTILPLDYCCQDQMLKTDLSPEKNGWSGRGHSQSRSFQRCFRRLLFH